MGILKVGLKIVGSTALGTAGIASAILRKCAYAAGSEELANAIGNIEDKSFDTIRDMWTSDDEKNEKYYEAQAERQAERAENAMRSGEAMRREYEKAKENNNPQK